MAKFLGTTHRVVRYSQDTLKPEGIKGYYLFSNGLSDKEIEDLIEISK